MILPMSKQMKLMYIESCKQVAADATGCKHCALTCTNRVVKSKKILNPLEASRGGKKVF